MEFENNDPIFYIRHGDWRQQVRQCTYSEYQQHPENKDLYSMDEEEYEQIVSFFRLLEESNSKRFSVKLRDNDRKELLIKREEFNPQLHVIVENKDTIAKREFNITDMISSGKAPGFNTSKIRTSGTHGSMFHNHKLDEGAMEDLLDKGLDKAKVRAEQREKKFGKGRAFSNRGYGRRIRNVKRKRR